MNSHLDFANTYAAIEWPGDCAACDLTASACSWYIDGCCASCNHPEIPEATGGKPHDHSR